MAKPFWPACCLLLLLLGGFVSADEAPATQRAELPPPVKAAQQRRDQATRQAEAEYQRALERIKQAYLRELRSIADVLIRTNRIDDANAVQAEISRAEANGEPAEPPQTAADAAEAAAPQYTVYAAGNNDCEIRINGEVLGTVRRETATIFKTALKPGDQVTARIRNRHDINSLWLAVQAPDGRWLLETDTRWHSYAPPDKSRWWVPDRLTLRACEIADPKREYASMVHEAAQGVTDGKAFWPITATVNANDESYFIYVVQPQDLAERR